MADDPKDGGQTPGSPDEDSPQARGGKARRDALTPEQRKEIARHAALSRWDSEVPQATHEGVVRIGNAEISAAVLPNGKRLLTQGTFYQAIGRSRTPKAGTGVLATVDGTPFFLQADVLKPFLTEDLLASTTPIFYRDGSGRRAVGYDAQLLPMVAEVYLKMRDSFLKAKKDVPHQFAHIVEACDILMRALATVGIVSLVDEATGYQNVRDRQALQAILDRYLRKEFAAWAKRFPDEFYREIFRLRGWKWRGMQVNRPQCVAQYTNDFVWSRIAPGLLKELQTRNPKTEKGHRKASNAQILTDDVGLPALSSHLYAVVGLMRASETWDQLVRMVDRAFPKQDDPDQLRMFIDPPG